MITDLDGSLARAGLADTRHCYGVECWKLVRGDLGGASSEEWAAHVAWCFQAGWGPLVCVGYWRRGGIRGGDTILTMARAGWPMARWLPPEGAGN